MHALSAGTILEGVGETGNESLANAKIVSTPNAFYLGQAIGLILCGLVVRLVASCVVVLRNGFSWFEITFVAIAWLPKATVQVSTFLRV